MTFWDTSALLALVLHEPRMEHVARVLAADRELAVWWATKVEATAGICRSRSDGSSGKPTISALAVALERLLRDAYEIGPTEEIRDTACRLLRVHPLRAADALQLSAALVWAEHRPLGRGFVCLDARLREAAEREGFDVTPG